MATSFASGKKIRAQEVFKAPLSVLRPEETPRGMGEEIYTRMMADLKAQIQAQAQEEAQIQIDAANDRVKAAEALRDAAIEARDLSRQMETSLQSRLQEMQSVITALRAEIAEEEEPEEDDPRIDRIETALAGLSKQISQIAAKPVQKIIQTPQAPIPTFDVIPVRDGMGNIVGATVKPIGGH